MGLWHVGWLTPDDAVVCMRIFNAVISRCIDSCSLSKKGKDSKMVFFKLNTKALTTFCARPPPDDYKKY